MRELGERFARALAEKDAPALRGLLDPAVDFRGLTPNRAWEAASADALVDEVLLGSWFEPQDRVDALEAVHAGAPVGERAHVAYRLRVTNPDGTYVVEQQAYYAAADGRITWLRVLCSGFQPLDA